MNMETASNPYKYFLDHPMSYVLAVAIRVVRRMRERHDTVVIGGGQAGLAMSAVLQQRGREHVVLERQEVGGRWRTEPREPLRFQFPNWSLQLPGYAYSGDDANSSHTGARSCA